MKRKISILLIIFIMIFSYVFVNLAYATTDETELLQIQETEVSVSSNLSVTINLSEINVEKYKLVLSSDTDLGTPTLDESNAEAANNLTFNLDTNTVETTIDTSEIALDSLTLNFTVSNINASITLKVYEILDDNTETLINTVTQTISTTENNLNNINTNINISENSSGIQTNSGSNFMDSFKDALSTMSDMVGLGQQGGNSSMSMGTMPSSSSNSNSLGNSAGSSLSGSSMSSATKTVTYNGSSNTYLSSLSIDGYSFTSDFNKTNLSYFVNVDNSVTSIDVSSVAEDSTSSVSVYGNNDLSVGTNKVLVTVTSENGNTKTYRIYVNRAK